MRKLVPLVALSLMLAALAVPTVGAATTPATQNVKIGDDLAFHPGHLKIKKGTKVVWTWGGMLPHNVTVISGPSKFHSATMTSGTYSHKFKKKGTYTLECTIHGFMMTVKVK